MACSHKLGVAIGKVVGLALRARLTMRPDINYASFYDRLESFAFGRVTGTSNVRNMAGDDAYVLITKKGKLHAMYNYVMTYHFHISFSVRRGNFKLLDLYLHPDLSFQLTLSVSCK